MTVYIGTSGFDYPAWKGIFYPPDLRRKDFLNYYSTVFNALEVNSTFYNMPTKEQMLSFYERSEGRVTFSIKANRSLTHEVTSDWKDQANDILSDKGGLGPVLYQPPPTFDYTVPNRKHLAALLQEFKNFNPVVEFRNPGWIKESAFIGLVDMSASLVFVDMPHLIKKPDGSVASPFIGSTAYVRFHQKSQNIIETSFFRRNYVINDKQNLWLIFYNYSDGISLASYYSCELKKRYIKSCIIL